MATTAFRTGVRGQQQQVFSQQAGFAQQAFSQQAGFAQQAGAHGFGQAFSQQAGAQAFGATFSQQAGAHGFGQAFSQQAGAQAFGQAFSQQAGAAQAFSAPHAFSQQHFTLPHRWQANRSFIPLNRSHRLQQVSQVGLQQAGSGAQHLTAGLQHAGAAQASHLPQPSQFRPARRTPRSKLNPWLARATLTRSAPSTILAFIEQTLLNNELG